MTITEMMAGTCTCTHFGAIASILKNRSIEERIPLRISHFQPLRIKKPNNNNNDVLGEEVGVMSQFTEPNDFLSDQFPVFEIQIVTISVQLMILASSAT